MNTNKYLAELVATFSLAFAVSASIVTAGAMPVATPVVAGLVLGLFVYTIGGISGAHLNPAITIALATLRKITLVDALMYILAQCLGAILALQITMAMFGSMPSIALENSSMILLAEAFGAFFLAFGVAYAVKKGDCCANGLVVGSSLLLGILVAMGTSAGVINPAVALAVGGLENVSWAYTLGPILGAIVAMWLYTFLAGCCGGCGGKNKK